MFELFERFIANRRYFDAGRIISRLGSMLGVTPVSVPEGFYNARINVVPLDNCLHIFMVFENEADFIALPGDLAEVERRDDVKLTTKAVQLSELHAPQYVDGVLLHFMHTADVVPVVDSEGCAA